MAEQDHSYRLLLRPLLNYEVRFNKRSGLQGKITAIIGELEALRVSMSGGAQVSQELAFEKFFDHKVLGPISMAINVANKSSHMSSPGNTITQDYLKTLITAFTDFNRQLYKDKHVKLRGLINLCSKLSEIKYPCSP